MKSRHRGRIGSPMSVKASSLPLHGVLVVTDPRPVPALRYQGDLISSLEETVERADGSALAGTMKSGPALVRKQDGRNYFRLTELPAGVELHCSTVDCCHKAKLLSDSRDGEILHYCPKCAHVEFAMWMVGV
jgi:hypothetical protein